eukprot:Gb_21221 [translate_table: standard]
MTLLLSQCSFTIKVAKRPPRGDDSSRTQLNLTQLSHKQTPSKKHMKVEQTGEPTLQPTLLENAASWNKAVPETPPSPEIIMEEDGLYFLQPTSPQLDYPQILNSPQIGKSLGHCSPREQVEVSNHGNAMHLLVGTHARMYSEGFYTGKECNPRHYFQELNVTSAAGTLLPCMFTQEEASEKYCNAMECQSMEFYKMFCNKCSHYNIQEECKGKILNQLSHLRIGIPAATHDLCQCWGAILRYSWPYALVHDCKCRLHCCHVLEGKHAGYEFPQDNPKTVDIHFVIIGSMLDHFPANQCKCSQYRVCNHLKSKRHHMPFQ